MPSRKSNFGEKKKYIHDSRNVESEKFRRSTENPSRTIKSISQSASASSNRLQTASVCTKKQAQDSLGVSNAPSSVLAQNLIVKIAQTGNLSPRQTEKDLPSQFQMTTSSDFNGSQTGKSTTPAGHEPAAVKSQRATSDHMNRNTIANSYEKSFERTSRALRQHTYSKVSQADYKKAVATFKKTSDAFVQVIKNEHKDRVEAFKKMKT